MDIGIVHAWNFFPGRFTGGRVFPFNQERGEVVGVEGPLPLPQFQVCLHAPL